MFNCHGFKSSVYDILLLCEQFDVIILQELWLSNEDISLLRYIHKAFEAYVVSAMNDQLDAIRIWQGRTRRMTRKQTNAALSQPVLICSKC